MVPAWMALAWSIVDGRLRGLSDGLQRFVRRLRQLRVVLILLIVLTVALAVAVLVEPAIQPYALAAVIFLQVIPLCVLLLLVGLPLRMQSAVRLIDAGYPENAKELFIRILARKMRDQSIETEELLFETAVSEARKVMHRMESVKVAMQDNGEDEDAEPDLAESDTEASPPSDGKQRGPTRGRRRPDDVADESEFDRPM